jgi:plastocyanin
MKRNGWFETGLVLGILALALGTATAEDEIRVVIKDHQFSPSEVRVKANTKLKLIVSNEDATAEEFESFSLNREKVVRAGQSITIFLPPLRPGSYDFFGDFHPDTAKGKVIAE